MESFDKTAYYNAQIAPLVAKIRRLCNEQDIPFFYAFGVHTDDKGKFVKNRGIIAAVLLPQYLNIDCDDDRFAEFVNIMNGMHTAPFQRPDDDYDVDMLSEKDFEEIDPISLDSSLATPDPIDLDGTEEEEEGDVDSEDQ